MLEEKREEFLTAGYVFFELKNVPVSHTRFVQFGQNQNILKPSLVFPAKARNAEILLGGSLQTGYSYRLFRDLLSNGALGVRP